MTQSKLTPTQLLINETLSHLETRINYVYHDQIQLDAKNNVYKKTKDIEDRDDLIARIQRETVLEIQEIINEAKYDPNK